MLQVVFYGCWFIFSSGVYMGPMEAERPRALIAENNTEYGWSDASSCVLWMLVHFFIRSLHGSNGGRASASPDLGTSLLAQVGPLCGVAEVGLGLAELGEVEGGNLLLVGPDPALQLVDQILHALVVLAILVSGKCELLDAALGPAQVLL